jgi:hypothetical protein
MLAVRPEVRIGPHLPDVFGRVGAGRISYRNRIRSLGKWTSWTVLRLFGTAQNRPFDAAHDRPVEQGLRGRVVALADQLQIFVPVAHRRYVDRAALLGAVAALVEPVEHGDGEARVVAVARDRRSVGTRDGLGDPLEHLLPGMVDERAAGELVRGVPARREHAVALGQRVSRGAAHAGIFARGSNRAGVGDGLEEELAQERGPAVAAHALRRAALVSVEEIGDQPAALIFGGEPFVFAQDRVFGVGAKNLPPCGGGRRGAGRVCGRKESFVGVICRRS